MATNETRRRRWSWVGGTTLFVVLTFWAETALAAPLVGALLGDTGWDVIRVFGLVGGLVYYRKHKKFKHERPVGILDFVERNFVEIVIGGLLFPALVPIAGSAIKTFIPELTP